MDLKRIYFIPIITLSVVFVSCFRGGEDLGLSDNPDFVSLTFLKNDSIPGLERAFFTLAFDEEFGDTIIVNLDSLGFNVRIDSVFPVFQFRSTFYARLFQETPEGSDTIILKGNSTSDINDTINFTFPTKVQNVSADGLHSRTYHIKINVHQIEPNLYVWQRLNHEITPNVTENQRALFFNNRYLFYTENSLFTTADENLTVETQWLSKTLTFNPPVTNLLRLRQIVENRQWLFVIDNENNLYASTDGETWNQMNYNLTGSEIYNLLFSMNDVLWAISRTATGEYRLVFSETGEQWTDWGALPEREDNIRKFPIGGYYTLVFRSQVGRPKVIVVGGYDQTGQLIRTNWIGQPDLNNQMVFEPLRMDALPPIHNASVIQYDNKLLLFGGMNEYSGVIPLLESRNEGLNWNVPDSAFNVLPETFTARAYQSVILNETDKRIFLIGGRNSVASFSDVWTVKLNRMYWQ